MRNGIRFLMVAVTSAGILSAFGCSPKKEEAALPHAGQQTDAALPVNSEANKVGDDAAAAKSGGTVSGLWQQIDAEKAKLSAVIENGQLKDVHHLAFGVRDLVIALAERAAGETPAAGPNLRALVDRVKSSASELDELGDAGNLSGTQAEFAKLDDVLKQLRAVTKGGAE